MRNSHSPRWEQYNLVLLIVGLGPASERRRYFATTSLIGWTQTKNQLVLLVVVTWPSLAINWHASVVMGFIINKTQKNFIQTFNAIILKI